MSSRALSATYDPAKLTLAARMRVKRFDIVNGMIADVLQRKGSCHILDVGGSEYYWNLNRSFIEANRERLRITITNFDETELHAAAGGVFAYRFGDATKAALYAGDHDMVHSNSVIEHVGGWTSVRAMAENIVRQPAPYYVQTPNYWFPMEPHFRTLGFQWLPVDARASLLAKRPRGFRSAADYDAAMENIESVNLLSHGQVRRLFPDAQIVRERFLGLTKSFMAVRRG